LSNPPEGLSPADDQHDRITAPLDRAGARALADHAADSPGASAAHRAHRAVPLPDLPLRGSEAKATASDAVERGKEVAQEAAESAKERGKEQE
jgi:hypothetical protein